MCGKIRRRKKHPHQIEWTNEIKLDSQTPSFTRVNRCARVYAIMLCIGVNLKSKIKFKSSLVALEWHTHMYMISGTWMGRCDQFWFIVRQNHCHCHYSSEIRCYWSFDTNAVMRACSLSLSFSSSPLFSLHHGQCALSLWKFIIILIQWIELANCECTGNY